MKVIESERLRLRHWQPKDFDAYAAYYADEESAKYIGGACDRNQAWRRMAAELGHWTLRGFGFWALEEKETTELVGCTGLWFPEGWPELEVGYWLLQNGRGKGYATEAARRAREYAYETLGAKTLVSYIHLENEPSKRVAERIGAHYEKTIELLDFGPHCVYRHPAAPGE
jgi:RimJ/RimL family protein N-acetyltransferase